jgi:hypothetical protein
MEKQLTVLQEAIENIEKRVVELNNMDEVNNLWKSSCAEELLKQRDYFVGLLPKEREQIKLARENGFTNGVTFERHNHHINTFEEYFTNTYKAEEK